MALHHQRRSRRSARQQVEHPGRGVLRRGGVAGRSAPASGPVCSNGSDPRCAPPRGTSVRRLRNRELALERLRDATGRRAARRAAPASPPNPRPRPGRGAWPTSVAESARKRDRDARPTTTDDDPWSLVRSGRCRISDASGRNSASLPAVDEEHRPVDVAVGGVEEERRRRRRSRRAWPGGPSARAGPRSSGPSRDPRAPPGQERGVHRTGGHGVEADTGLAPGAGPASHGAGQGQLAHAVDGGAVERPRQAPTPLPRRRPAAARAARLGGVRPAGVRAR